MPLPYDSVGTGQPLVLLHAGVADRTMWSEHLEPLAATGRRVIAPDLPGFGEADILPGEQAAWLDVISTMDELGIERAELIGSSFGAAVGLRVAAIAPSRVSIDCVAMGGYFLETILLTIASVTTSARTGFHSGRSCPE